MYSVYLRIKEKTEEKGISGKELGALLGLKKSPLTDWKNEKSCPTLEQLKKMCDIFATSADYLLLGKTPSNNSDLSKTDRLLLDYFHNMTLEDQNELLMIAEMKFRKEKKNLDAKLSTSQADDMLA